MEHIVEVSVSKHFRGKQFIQFDDLLREATSNEYLSLFNKLIFVFLDLEWIIKQTNITSIKENFILN